MLITKLTLSQHHMCMYVVYNLYRVKFQNWSKATCFQRLNGVIEYVERSVAKLPRPNGRIY